MLASFRGTLCKHGCGALKAVEIIGAEHPDNAGLIGAAALFHDREH
jgi:hypothetical protein